jgi:hypothetical protein
MNRLLIAFCMALTVAACVSTPSTSPARVGTAGNASVLGNCAPINPSAPQTNCQNVNASAYTQQQWETRGVTNTAEALRQTSPAVSVR